MAKPLHPMAVSSYDEAKQWLWRHSRVADWIEGDNPLPPEALLICAIYWVSPSHLVRDLRKTWSQVFMPPARPRRGRSHGWGR